MAVNDTQLSLLIVDDEQDVTEALCYMLRKQPYEITTANHPHEAMEIARRTRVDIMITDIRMPDMNGMELLQEMRRINQDMMVIAISAHGNLDTAVEFMKEGGVDFLQKPVSNETLRLAIRSAAEKWHLRHDLRVANEALKVAHEQLTDNQQRLAESEAKYRLLAQNAADVIWTVDTDLCLTYVSPSIEHVLGYRASEIMGKTVMGVIPENNREKSERVLHDDLERSTHGSKSVIKRYEVELLKADGERVWTETMVSSLLDDQGRLIGLQGVLRDVTEQKNAELQLRVHLQFMETLINTIPNPVFYKDTKGVFQGCNHRFAEEVLRIPRSQIEGHTLIDLECALGRESREHLHAEDVYLINRPGVFSEEVVVTTDDDELRYFITYRATYTDVSGNVAGLVGIMLDITARKQIEVDLKEAKELAESAARVKSEFLANMSHEIRTPLNAVTGLTELLADTPLNVEQKDYVDTIAVSGEALLSIIDHILNMSKIESGMLELEKVPYDVRKCAESALNIVSPKAAEKHLELIYDVGPNVPYSVIGDLGRLRQILVNLLNNAVKFTEQGEVVLSVSAGERLGGRCRIHFAVRDSGIGIPAAQLSNIFDPFKQADSSTTRRFGGTGLGLAICRELCEMMGGELTVTSEEGQGAEFSFFIEVQLPAQEELPLNLLPSLEGRSVLLSIANRVLFRVLEGLLNNWGIRVVECGNSSTLERLLNENVAIDMAIIDSYMINKSVKIAEILKAYRDVPVVFLAAVGAEKNLAPGLVDTWLMKPVKPWLLRELLVQHILHQNIHQDEERSKGGKLLDCPLKVLIAEDNLVNQKVAMKMLKNIGFDSDVVGSGEEALVAIAETSYDVVFMDIQMPGKDGLETTMEIRRKRIPLYIIGMTAHALPEDRNRCIAAGMDSYIAKPVKQELLIEALKEAQKYKLTQDQAGDAFP